MINRRVNLIAGHDVIAQAQSGTGKTATFCISVLERIDVTRKELQALILAPTRELAKQSHTVRIYNIIVLSDIFSLPHLLVDDVIYNFHA